MSEHDANRALLDTARLRIVDDPLEQTQRMPVYDRRERQHEGRMMHEAARGQGHARAMVNNPVYRNQEIAAGMREANAAWADAHPVQIATGTALDALAGIPQRPLGMTDAQLREETMRRWRGPDFRDGRCVHGNLDFTCHICAVEQGRVHEWGE